MSRTDHLAKIQHYVPQFILRNFTSGKKHQLFAFDKKKGISFKTNIKNIASEKGFYNFKIEDEEYSLEEDLGELEETSSKIVKKIINDESLSNISDEEKTTLSFFIAAQYFRVKQMRNHYRHLSIELEKRFSEMGIDTTKIENFSVVSEEEAKNISIMSIASADKIAPYIFDKTWMLFKAPKSTPYYISDNPVTLQNMLDFGPLGNLGFGVLGIEIYFPISSTLSLGIMCRSHEEKLRQSYEEYERNLRKFGPEISMLLRMNLPPNVEALMTAMKTGKFVNSLKENAINKNSLQVMYSSRFVYSSIDDFDLAREMIKKNPDFKQGPIPQVH